MKRTFICNILPPEYIVKLKASQAAINFCNRLVDGGCFDDVRSIVPVSYKLPKRIFYRNITYYVNNGNNMVAKILRYVYLNMKLAWDVKRFDAVWFYNLTASSLLSYIILKFLFMRRVYVIMADYTPPLRKKSMQTIIGGLLKRCNGMIALSARSCFDQIKNLHIKAGIIDEEMLNRSVENVRSDKITFLFSGTLTPVTGYEMALKVFSQIPEAQLFVSGNGAFPDIYRKYENIHFMGNLPYNDYLELLESVTVCLNFRNPNLPENNNNFPSKILDYFSRHKIVLSTMSYPEIEGANYIYSDFDESVLIKKVMDIVAMGVDNLTEYTNNTMFLRENFSVSSCKNMIRLVEKK